MASVDMGGEASGRRGSAGVGMIAAVACMAAAWGGAALAEDGERLVRGVVVDEAGKPAAGVIVSESWHRTDLPRMQTSRCGVETDERGEFRLRTSANVLMAMDYGREAGALFRTQREEDEAELRVQLKPLATLIGGFSSEVMNTTCKRTIVFVYAKDEEDAIGAFNTEAPGFAISLPPGEYRLTFDHDGCLPCGLAVSLPEGTRVYSLGEIELRRSELAERCGQRPPELALEAEYDTAGSGAGFSLERMRGKPAIVSCYEGIDSMYSTQYDALGGRGDVQIVAIISDAEKPLNEAVKVIHEHEERLSKMGVRARFILNRGRSTMEQWGYGRHPMHLLLDGEGLVFDECVSADLEEALERLKRLR